MTTIDELTKIIKDYYNEQVRLGKGKSLDECDSLCIPIASIPLHLREHKINWKTDFKYDKLPDLLQSLKGIGVLRRKPCYIYVDSTTTTQRSIRLVNILHIILEMSLNLQYTTLNLMR